MGGNSRGNARARLLVIGRAFLVLDARVGQWRENTRTTINSTLSLSYLPATYIYTVSRILRCSSWEVARGSGDERRRRRPNLLNVFPLLFFLNRIVRVFRYLREKRDEEWDERREDADKSSLRCSIRDIQVLTLLSRATELKENRETPSGIQESERPWMRRGGMLFNIPFWSLVLSRARGLERRRQVPRKRKRVREREGKRNVPEWCEARIVSFRMLCHPSRFSRALLAPPIAFLSS